MQKIKKILYLIVFIISSFFLINKGIAASYPFEGMIDADALVIKDGTDGKANKITELVFGSKVTVTGESGSYYKITFDNDKQGYASKSYVINVKQYASTSGDYRNYCNSLISKGFVEAYCPQLYYLHMAYPNWTFTADVTGLTLEEASKKEEDKSVLATGNSNYYLRDKPIEESYYYIKANVIASFMDPRNVMYPKRIFQYLDLQSSKDIVNDAAMAKVVGSGNLKNYFEEYKKAALTHNINPLHILVRSWQEGANKATYSAVTGLYTTNSGRTSHQGFSLDGYYNFYNIGSYQTSTYPYTVQRGLAYGAGFLEDEKCMTTNTETGITVYDTNKCGELSYQRPWNTQERAIVGGAEFIANGYVRKGQDTLYYQKFNVSSRHQYTLYTHQYMTNIMAPNDEGKRLYEAYEAGGLLNSKFNFIIPVYKDLAGESAQPVDKNGDATLKEIRINGNLIAGFDKDVVEYPYSLQTNNDSFDVTATANTPLTKVSGTGKYTFNNGSVVVSIKTTAEDGTNKTYTVTVKQVKISNEVKVKDVTDKLNVKVDNTVIFGIKPGMTAQELINSVSSANGKAVLTDANGNNKSSGKLATGDIITINGSVEKTSFTIIVRGDINGDSNINAIDLLLCKKDILNINKLKNNQLYAVDVNYDSKINAVDLLLIKKHILGLSQLWEDKMKRIKYLLFTLIVSIVGLVSVSAASISISASSKNITVGGTVKITVKVNGTGMTQGSIGSWEYTVNYDSSIFQFVSSNTDGGNLRDTGTAGETTTRTFTFKAKASGAGTFSLTDVLTVDGGTDNPFNVSIGATTVTIKSQNDISSDTKEKTGSDNAYLRALEVVGYTLSPAFDKKTQSYEVEVPNDVTEVGINAFKEDPKAIISTNAKDIDHIELTEGINKIIITVRAEKGNKLEYVVNIKRSEEDPIVVNIDGKEYTVLRSLEEIDKPKYYTDSSLEIEEQTVESLSSDVTGYTLVALKDEDGNVVLFSYSEGSYERYVEVNNELTTLIPKETKKLIEGFTQSKEIDINGNKVTVYYNDSNSDFVLLYAMNVGNGETAWYSYDIKEGTLQRYNGEVKVEKKGKDIYFYLAIAFAVISGLAILIVFIVLGLNNRLKKKNDLLVNKLKDKKVKIVEHPVFDLDMKVDSWKDIKNDDDISDTEFFARPDDTMVKINEDVEIKDDAFETEETPIVEEEEEKTTKRREKKKLKEDKEKEEAELKAMRDDFLKTRELEITKEMRKAGESKKAKKKAKKKKK